MYVALDAASFIHPLHGLNITPWNPAPALGLVFLLRHGPRARILLIATVVLSEWIVRGVPQSWWASLVSALVLAAGYILLGEILRRALPQTALLDDRASLWRWFALVAFGTLVNSLVYLTSLLLLGLLPSTGWQAGVVQFWVGDAVGIAVAMPLFWWLTSERGRGLLRESVLRWETLGYMLLGIAALLLAFGFGGGDGFKLFYVLFLPIVWASARQGMAGAIVSATLLQIGVIVAVQMLGYSAVTIAELQILALTMAMVGFLIGSVVDEQGRTSADLRQSLRLAAAGEMAGALAHEINQPLTAMMAYASACETLLARGETGERLNTAIKGMLVESSRTGEVVRRLRDFFRTGATRLEVVTLSQVVEQAIEPYQRKARQADVSLIIAVIPEVSLLVDRLQIELVLRNLLANAFDAIADAVPSRQEVSVGIDVLPGRQVEISIEDSGPGVNEERASRLFEPYRSSKSSGMGLGLVISRALVETHGGRLWGEVADHGVFKLVLPTHEVSENV